MPIRNTTKYYSAPAYYHIYNRGAGGGDIFLDDQDRAKFLSLLERHLDGDSSDRKTDGSEYDKYDLELVAYCLMNNHFHLLAYQENEIGAVTQLMRSVATSYTMYFNRKHKRQGHLFQSVFKASRIKSDAYLTHITRYIHMNPRSYMRYKWSSLTYYLGAPPPAWLHPERVSDMSPATYRQFLKNYEGKKAEMDLLKEILAT